MNLNNVLFDAQMLGYTLDVRYHIGTKKIRLIRVHSPKTNTVAAFYENGNMYYGKGVVERSLPTYTAGYQRFRGTYPELITILEIGDE